MPSFAQCLAIIVGSLLIAAGIDFYLVPYHIMDGGFIGVGLIFHYLFGFKIGNVIILCSIPVFLVSWYNEREFPLWQPPWHADVFLSDRPVRALPLSNSPAADQQRYYWRRIRRIGAWHHAAP